jgi:glycosyltransferase involved in cell wall biosynthesis
LITDSSNTCQPTRIRLAFVQPIMPPYRRPLFEHLSTRPEIDLKVYVLAESFSHRQAWRLKPEESFRFEVVGAIQQWFTTTTRSDLSVRALRVLSPQLARRIAVFQPHAVICTNITEYMTLLPLRWMHPCTIGCWVEDTPFTSSQCYSLLHGRFREFMHRRMDFFLVNGTESRKYLIGAGIDTSKITNIMCSVDNSLYGSHPGTPRSASNARKQWITVGSLIPRKGFKELIHAWSRQDRNFLESNQLVIVGDGSDMNQLQKLIDELLPAGSARLAGPRSPDELAVMYTESDVFVFPTLLDIWGLVVNEAMAAGLPIMCSKYAGCCTDLVDGSNGVAVDPLDPDALARAIHDFSLASHRWREMGAASLRIISSYTTTATAAAITDAVRTAVMRSR